MQLSHKHTWKWVWTHRVARSPALVPQTELLHGPVLPTGNCSAKDGKAAHTALVQQLPHTSPAPSITLPSHSWKDHSKLLPKYLQEECQLQSCFQSVPVSTATGSLRAALTHPTNTTGTSLTEDVRCCWPQGRVWGVLNSLVSSGKAMRKHNPEQVLWKHFGAGQKRTFTKVCGFSIPQAWNPLNSSKRLKNPWKLSTKSMTV